MAWTAAQLATVETAIIAISAGAEEVEIQGKRYRKPNLKALLDLRDQMTAEIQTESDGGVGYFTFKDKAAI